MEVEHSVVRSNNCDMEKNWENDGESNMWREADNRQKEHKEMNEVVACKCGEIARVCAEKRRKFSKPASNSLKG